MAGDHTKPEKIIDKNGKETTVHKGRKTTTNVSQSRLDKLPKPSPAQEDIVQIGSEFFDFYADSIISFTVAEVRGDVVIADAGDNEWGIVSQPFAINDVKRAIVARNLQNTSIQSNEEFWLDVEEGSTYHFENFAGQYVRGTIVIAEDGQTKKFLPQALVGQWAEYDLPSRGRDGEVNHSFHSRSIVDKKLMQPHMSNFWENKDAAALKNNSRYMKFNNGQGPIGVEPVDLSVPDLSEDEKKELKLDNLLRSISDVAGYYIPAEERIEKLRSLLKEIDENL